MNTMWELSDTEDRNLQSQSQHSRVLQLNSMFTPDSSTFLHPALCPTRLTYTALTNRPSGFQLCFTNGEPQQEAERREESEVRVFILLVLSYEVSLSPWCPSTEAHYWSQGVCPTQLSHVGSRTSSTSYLSWSRAGDCATASPRFLNTLPTPTPFTTNFFANKPYSNYPNLSDVPISC